MIVSDRDILATATLTIKPHGSSEIRGPTPYCEKGVCPLFQTLLSLPTLGYE